MENAAAPATPNEESAGPIPLTNAAATQGHITTEAKAPSVAANDKTVTEEELKTAEDRLAKYLGKQLAADEKAAHFLKNLKLDVKPAIAGAEHTALNLHFTGAEAAADPLAFAQAVEAVLKHHPLVAALANRPEHPVQPSSHCDCCSVELKLPQLSEHEFQTVIDQLAKTPLETLTPLTDAPAAATPKTTLAPTASQGSAVEAPASSAVKAPLATVANDNASARHEGTVAAAQVAAAR